MSKTKKKKKHRLFWHFFRIQLALLVLVLGAAAYYFYGGYGKQVEELRQEAVRLVRQSDVNTFKANQTSIVYASDGSVISTLKGEKDSYYVSIEEMPVDAVTAIVSIEDKKFFRHHGIDYRALLRAVKAMVQNGEVKQGGSTITMQLARNIFLSQEKTWQRKVEEMYIATELENKYSKDQILEFYLNNIYFGNGYYGIQSAARGYFDRDVESLSLSQIAFLCAIPNNPTLYDPVTNKDNTVSRRDRILKNMLDDGKISQMDYAQAVAEQITLNRPQALAKNDYVETYTYYCATRALMEQQGFVFHEDFKTDEEQQAYEDTYNALYSECQKKLYTGGYRIFTSIDLSLQDELQQSVNDTLSGYTGVNDEGVYELQASAVCIDNDNGYVRAVVGGRSQEFPGYTLNRAYQSFRQPGSAIKPLTVYTPSFEQSYTPDSIVVDEPIEDGNGTVLYNSGQNPVLIYKKNAARMMTDVLKGVITNGTGKGLDLGDMPCAGKTGTTNDQKDGWFVGYTRYYTTSVWVGYDMPKKLEGLMGNTYPGKIWQSFMSKAHEGLEPLEFLPYARISDDLLQQQESGQPEDNPAEETPEEGAQDGETPGEEIPEDGAQDGETPGEEIPEDGAQDGESPVGETPENAEN